MHYSRISVAPSQAYSAATAVLLNELLKGSISVVIALKRIDDDMTLNPPPSLWP
jgi:UDP-sugar transporter A1/2/3